MTVKKNIETSTIVWIKDPSRIDISKPGVARCLMTPDLAMDWLTRNDNRNRRQSHVDLVVKLIHRGEWRDDHPSPAVITTNSEVIDGQHRLAAIVESLKTLWLLCVFGADPALKGELGNQLPRVTADMVSLFPTHSHNLRACSMVKFILQSHRANKAKVTPGETQECFDQHADAMRWFIPQWPSGKGLMKVAIAVPFVEFYELDPVAADAFLQAYQDINSNVTQARLLREFMLRSLGQRGLVKDSEVYGKAVGAMLAFRNGKYLRKLYAAEWGHQPKRKRSRKGLAVQPERPA